MDFAKALSALPQLGDIPVEAVPQSRDEALQRTLGALGRGSHFPAVPPDGIAAQEDHAAQETAQACGPSTSASVQDGAPGPPGDRSKPALPEGAQPAFSLGPDSTLSAQRASPAPALPRATLPTPDEQTAAHPASAASPQGPGAPQVQPAGSDAAPGDHALDGSKSRSASGSDHGHATSDENEEESGNEEDDQSDSDEEACGKRRKARGDQGARQGADAGDALAALLTRPDALDTVEEDDGIDYSLYEGDGGKTVDIPALDPTAKTIAQADEWFERMEEDPNHIPVIEVKGNPILAGIRAAHQAMRIENKSKRSITRTAAFQSIAAKEPEQDFKMALNIFLDTVKGKGVSQDLVKEALSEAMHEGPDPSGGAETMRPRLPSAGGSGAAGPSKSRKAAIPIPLSSLPRQKSGSGAKGVPSRAGSRNDLSTRMSVDGHAPPHPLPLPSHTQLDGLEGIELIKDFMNDDLFGPMDTDNLRTSKEQVALPSVLAPLPSALMDMSVDVQAVITAPQPPEPSPRRNRTGTKASAAAAAAAVAASIRRDSAGGGAAWPPVPALHLAPATDAHAGAAGAAPVAPAKRPNGGSCSTVDSLTNPTPSLGYDLETLATQMSQPTHATNNNNPLTHNMSVTQPIPVTNPGPEAAIKQHMNQFYSNLNSNPSLDRVARSVSVERVRGGGVGGSGGGLVLRPAGASLPHSLTNMHGGQGVGGGVGFLDGDVPRVLQHHGRIPHMRPGTHPLHHSASMPVPRDTHSAPLTMISRDRRNSSNISVTTAGTGVGPNPGEPLGAGWVPVPNSRGHLELGTGELPGFPGGHAAGPFMLGPLGTKRLGNRSKRTRTSADVVTVGDHPPGFIPLSSVTGHTAPANAPQSARSGELPSVPHPPRPAHAPIGAAAPSQGPGAPVAPWQDWTPNTHSTPQWLHSSEAQLDNTTLQAMLDDLLPGPDTHTHTTTDPQHTTAAANPGQENTNATHTTAHGTGAAGQTQVAERAPVDTGHTFLDQGPLPMPAPLNLEGTTGLLDPTTNSPRGPREPTSLPNLNRMIPINSLSNSSHTHIHAFSDSLAGLGPHSEGSLRSSSMALYGVSAAGAAGGAAPPAPFAAAAMVQVPAEIARGPRADHAAAGGLGGGGGGGGAGNAGWFESLVVSPRVAGGLGGGVGGGQNGEPGTPTSRRKGSTNDFAAGRPGSILANHPTAPTNTNNSPPAGTNRPHYPLPGQLTVPVNNAQMPWGSARSRSLSRADGDGMPGSPAAALHRHQSAALAGAGGAGAADALSSEDAIMHDADGADVAGGYNVGFNEGSGEVDDGFEEEEHLIKTNMGQQIRRISKTMLQQVYHLPINEAADQLGIGVTVLKKYCRKFQVERWPYRKLKSMDKLIQSVEEQRAADPQGTSFVLAKLHRFKQELYQNPEANFDEAIKKLRQANFKMEYKQRQALGLVSSGRGAHGAGRGASADAEAAAAAALLPEDVVQQVYEAAMQIQMAGTSKGPADHAVPTAHVPPPPMPPAPPTEDIVFTGESLLTDGSPRAQMAARARAQARATRSGSAGGATKRGTT